MDLEQGDILWVGKGRDVLGVVRLDEARRHKAKEKEILADISDDIDKETMKSLKQEAKAEKQEYSQLKKLRWPLLINSDKLSDNKTEQLQSIQQDHHDLAVCYAMKEEMCRLYELTDYQQSAPASSKASTTRSRSLNESATVTVMMTSSLP